MRAIPAASPSRPSPGCLGLFAGAMFLCTQPLAQTLLFKCVTDEGIEFSDRACESEAVGAPIMPSGESAAQRKAQNDSRLNRDKALTRQYEAEREAEEAELRAAQQRQLQIAADIARRLARERDARNAGTTSVLPATRCDLCRTPGTEVWPGYMR